MGTKQMHNPMGLAWAHPSDISWPDAEPTDYPHCFIFKPELTTWPRRSLYQRSLWSSALSVSCFGIAGRASDRESLQSEHTNIGQTLQGLDLDDLDTYPGAGETSGEEAKRDFDYVLQQAMQMATGDRSYNMDDRTAMSHCLMTIGMELLPCNSSSDLLVRKVYKEVYDWRLQRESDYWKNTVLSRYVLRRYRRRGTVLTGQPGIGSLPVRLFTFILTS